jgi:hypothetical protein
MPTAQQDTSSDDGDDDSLKWSFMSRSVSLTTVFKSYMAGQPSEKVVMVTDTPIPPRVKPTMT